MRTGLTVAAAATLLILSGVLAADDHVGRLIDNTPEADITPDSFVG